MEQNFKQNHIYRLNNIMDCIFLCEQIKGIGRIVLFRQKSKIEYNRTSIQYFLNSYVAGDMKAYVLNSENYELLGNLYTNYELSLDGKTLLRKI